MIFHDNRLFHRIKALLNGIMKKFCILRGYSGKTIFENNINNTSKKAFEAVKEGLNDGTERKRMDRESGQQQQREEPQEDVHCKPKQSEPV